MIGGNAQHIHRIGTFFDSFDHTGLVAWRPWGEVKMKTKNPDLGKERSCLYNSRLDKSVLLEALQPKQFKH